MGNFDDVEIERDTALRGYVVTNTGKARFVCLLNSEDVVVNPSFCKDNGEVESFFISDEALNLLRETPTYGYSKKETKIG